MKNLLIMGINTRPMVNSALKLDYNTFSISYFKTLDFINPYCEKHILHQENIESEDSFNCGSFEDNYSPEKLLYLAEEYLDAIDKIVFSTGISADDFVGKFSKFKNKIRGNLKTDNVNDKFKFYNKVKNKFNVPMTFNPVDIYEVIEIANQYANNQFILKPLKGSGGYGTFLLNKQTLTKFKTAELDSTIFEGNYLMQEYIPGVNLSSSLLSTKNESKNIINTRLLTTDDFVYSGNILPLTFESFSKGNSYIENFNFNNFNKFNLNSFSKLSQNMENVSEDLISYFNLIGSNGVDFILSKDAFKNESFDENDLYIIEVNPRIQGTYESCEEVLGINLLDAHIKACEGEIIDIPDINNNPNPLYSVKKIEYASSDINVKNLSFDNVYDIPYENVKIEENQPIVTIISSDYNLSLAISNLENASNNVKNNIEIIQ
ncbi:MAG: ATP-grasp domain-containing protein [archaeon]|nr:ATP-grasp domain-containing protein [archaeon]